MTIDSSKNNRRNILCIQEYLQHLRGKQQKKIEKQKKKKNNKQTPCVDYCTRLRTYVN